MIELPYLDDVFAEIRRRDIITVLSTRFGSDAVELANDMKNIEDEERLLELIKLAATCRTLKSFRKHLSP